MAVTFGPLGLGCFLIGLWQSKTKPRWYAAYVVWTVFLWVYCATGSYLIDPARYLGSKFLPTLFAPLPFSAITVAGVWTAIKRGREAVSGLGTR